MAENRSSETPVDLVRTEQAPVPRARDNALPPSFPKDEEEGGANPKRMLAAVLRYKWVILALTVLGTGGGAFATRYVEPEYVAQATVWIEQPDRRGGGSDAGPIQSEELLASSAWVDLLRSFVVLDYVVRSEKLYLHPVQPADSMLLDGFTLKERFAPGDFRLRVDRRARTYVLERGDGTRVESGSFGDSVGARIGFQWQPTLSSFPADRPVDFHISVPRQESLMLGNRLRTSLDKMGNFLRLELRGNDPSKTAGTLNAIAERYIEVAGQLKRAKQDELVKILDEQLADAQESLKESEGELESFKIHTVTLPSEPSTPITPGIAMTQGPVFQNFFDMRVQSEQLTRDREAILRALQDPNGVQPEAFEAIGSVQNSAELSAALNELTKKRADLRALQYQYTEEYPPLKQLAEEIRTLEQSTIPRLARSLASELAARRGAIEKNLTSASSELRQVPPRTIEEARLQRRVSIATNLYTTLQSRYEAARLAAASSIPDVRVLDEATVPQAPLADQKIQLILMAFGLSLGLGVAGAILRDRFDPRLRYADQVTREMGLTMLGSIPNLRKKRVNTEHTDEVLEAFRTIRLNVVNAYGSAGPLMLTISSPGPGDGKSFVASNLALSFSELGYRTLLVDGDIRRGTLHRVLDSERKPGLMDFLDGTIEEDQLIRHTRYERLHLITSGSRLRHGPELLSSAAMRDLLLGLRGDYDAILVDSPPLGAGVDPFALGTLTGNMLVVVRSGTTNRDMAESKLDLLERLPIRLLGAVFNGVPPLSGYGYYRYVPGYAARDENELHEPAQLEAPA